MFKRMISNLLRRRALQDGKSVGLWRKLGGPSAEDWTTYIKRHGGLHEMGENCFILPGTVFTDPEYVSLGNNVWLSDAWISCHDGSAIMVSRAYGVKLDAVGPVKIRDDVFIGVGAKILAGVTIGPRAIVGAGAVVTRDVPPNSVVAGNPARVIRSLDEHFEILKQRSDAYPWNPLIQKREGGFDPVIEDELDKMRIEHFFAKDDAIARNENSHEPA